MQELYTLSLQKFRCKALLPLTIEECRLILLFRFHQNEIQR